MIDYMERLTLRNFIDHINDEDGIKIVFSKKYLKYEEIAGINATYWYDCLVADYNVYEIPKEFLDLDIYLISHEYADILENTCYIVYIEINEDSQDINCLSKALKIIRQNSKYKEFEALLSSTLL